MKKLSILLLALASGSVMAHSHMPQKFGGKDKPEEAVTFTGTKLVPITVGNLNNNPVDYEITVRGDHQGTTGLIGGGIYKNQYVLVQLAEPNKPETVKICSTSIPNKGSTVSYRTRICTSAQLLWVKK